MQERKEQIQKFWNKSCADYDEHMEETGHYQAQRAILEKISPEIKAPLLDLACGTGYLLKLFSEKAEKIYANDFSLNMLDMTKNRFLNSNCDVTYVNESAIQLSTIKEQKFNTITCCNLFYYLHEDRPAAIKRWKELLLPGGHIIFVEEYPFVQPDSDEMDEHTEELMDIIDPISPQEIEKLMKDEGFSLVRREKAQIDDKHDLYGSIYTLV